MQQVYVVLSFQGKEYSATVEYPDNVCISYCLRDGNDSCDCTRSAMLRKSGYSDFPKLECGKLIHLVGYDTDVGTLKL